MNCCCCRLHTLTVLRDERLAPPEMKTSLTSLFLSHCAAAATRFLENAPAQQDGLDSTVMRPARRDSTGRDAFCRAAAPMEPTATQSLVPVYVPLASWRVHRVHMFLLHPTVPNLLYVCIFHDDSSNGTIQPHRNRGRLSRFSQLFVISRERRIIYLFVCHFQH